MEFQAKNEKLSLWSFRKVVNFCTCGVSCKISNIVIVIGVSGKRSKVEFQVRGALSLNNCFTLTELINIRKLPTITRMG